MPRNSTDKADRTIRILIVDDHPVVREGLGLRISAQSDMEVCGEAAESAEAMRKVKAKHPDLVIVDIALTHGNGLDLIRDIKAFDGRIRMLVSSMYDEALYAERAMRAGAMGYINKAVPTDRILEAIRHVARGDIYLSEQMTRRLLSQTFGTDKSLRTPMEALTDRELEVFELIGNGLTTRQIAERIFRSPKTVEAHRDHIKTKLNLHNSAELIREATRWVMERR